MTPHHEYASLSIVRSHVSILPKMSSDLDLPEVFINCPKYHSVVTPPLHHPSHLFTAFRSQPYLANQGNFFLLGSTGPDELLSTCKLRW